MSELELAEKRRGEAMAMFLDDWPTVHQQLAALQYWWGRAHEGLGAIPVTRQNYQAFLALRGASKDQLATDTQRRLAALGRAETR